MEIKIELAGFQCPICGGVYSSREEFNKSLCAQGEAKPKYILGQIVGANVDKHNGIETLGTAFVVARITQIIPVTKQQMPTELFLKIIQTRFVTGVLIEDMPMPITHAPSYKLEILTTPTDSSYAFNDLFPFEEKELKLNQP